MHRPRTRTESAFTLIELLVVMIIIAILMAVAVPTFLAQKNGAKKTKALANIKLIQDAMEACSAAKNLDGTYTGCAEHSYLYAFEKGLKSLPKCCVNNIEGEFDINGITDSGARVGTPAVDDPMYGYEVFTWLRDGDKEIWFQRINWHDGTVSKFCGEGTRPPLSKTKPPKVDGSRTCTNGEW